MAWLGALFVVLTVVFGIWGYTGAAGEPVPRLLFWVCLIITFLIYFAAWGSKRSGSPTR